MCDPVSATIAMTVVSAGFQIFQGQQAAAGIKAEAQANANVQAQNAETARVAAQDAMQRGAADAATIRENARRSNARLQAEAGGAGLVSNTGSLLDFLVQNRGMGELDALTTINNAEREAYGYKVQAAQSDANAANALSLGSYNAKTARMSGYTNAAGTLLTGFGKAGDVGGWWNSSATSTAGRGVSSNPTPIRVG